MKGLDERDYQLLDLLTHDAKTPTNVLAKELRLHKNSVLYRIERLQKIGVIKQFSMYPGFPTLGKDTFYVFFRLRLSEEKKQEIYTYLKNHPLALWVIRLIGKWNIMLELVCDDIYHFNNEIAKITDYLGDIVSDYRVVLLYFPYKVEPTINFRKEYVPKPFKIEKKVEIDALDKKILRILSENSALSYGKIANNITTSDTVFYRIKKLLNLGVIRKFVPIVDLQKLGFQRFFILLKLSDVNEVRFKALGTHIASNKNVFFAFRTTGELGVALFCAYKNTSELDIFLSKLNNLFSDILREQEVFPIVEDLTFEYYPKGLR